MEHHDIDVYPIPKIKKPRFINEPWLIDGSLLDAHIGMTEEELMLPEAVDDNIRLYVPLDINAGAILRRLRWLVCQYGEASEWNESYFSLDVERLVSQIEIYDQIWSLRRMPKEAKHSREAVALVEQFVSILEDIPDEGAECFPFELIDELREEYLM